MISGSGLPAVGRTETARIDLGEFSRDAATAGAASSWPDSAGQRPRLRDIGLAVAIAGIALLSASAPVTRPHQILAVKSTNAGWSASADMLYLATGDQYGPTTIGAFRLTDGARIWRFDAPAGHTVSGVVAGDPVLFRMDDYCPPDASVIALDATTGALRWHRSGWLLASGHGHVVLVRRPDATGCVTDPPDGSTRQVFDTVSSDTGALLASVSVDGQGQTSLDPAGAALAIWDSTGRMTVRDLVTGTVTTATVADLAGDTSGLPSPTVQRAGQGWVVRRVTIAPSQPPAVTITALDGRLRQLWRLTLPGRATSDGRATAALEGYVTDCGSMICLVDSNGGRIMALDPATGQERWHQAFSGMLSIRGRFALGVIPHTATAQAGFGLPPWPLALFDITTGRVVRQLGMGWPGRLGDSTSVPLARVGPGWTQLATVDLTTGELHRFGIVPGTYQWCGSRPEVVVCQGDGEVRVWRANG